MTKPVSDHEIVGWLRKASSAIYLACEAVVADDISPKLKEAADEIERLRKGESICIKCGQRQHAEASYDIQF